MATTTATAAPASDNIFSGLKVVDLASFVAAPGAAVIPSDFGADVIKVEPPNGDLWRHAHKIPPQPQAEDPYPRHLTNRNKRGMTLDLKAPSAQEVLERLVKWTDVLIVNTPHPARKKLKLEYEDVAQWNPRLIYAGLTGFGEKGPDANLPGFDITSYWARSGLRDAGAPPTWPVAGSGDNATAVGLYSAIVTALYRRERTGKGAYVMVLAVFTAFVGMMIAPSRVNLLLGFVAILAIAAGAGAAGVLNMWYDADIDAVMTRTARRPIPRGKVSRAEALAFGLALAGSAVVVLALALNVKAAGLLAFAIFFYVAAIDRPTPTTCWVPSG
jgi:crotonobetainyl-CoA:carnitine CoA-transferase CaiB-like acyl-CoA transferase